MQISGDKCCLGRQQSVNSHSSTFDKNTGTYCNNPLLHSHPQHNYPRRDGWHMGVFGSHCFNKTGPALESIFSLFSSPGDQARLLLTTVIYLWQRGVTLQHSHACSQAAVSSNSLKLTKRNEPSPNPPRPTASSVLIYTMQTQTPDVLFFWASANFCSKKKKHVLCLTQVRVAPWHTSATVSLSRLDEELRIPWTLRLGQKQQKWATVG